MEGWGWQKLHDPVLLPQVMKSWNNAIAAEQVFDMEFPLRGADGQFRIFLTRAEPLRNSEGHIVKWLGTNTDVHDQRLAEQARRETENQLQVVMENMTEGLVVSDFSRKLLHWNRAALKMHDVTSADEALRDLDSFASMYELSTLDGAVLPAKLWPLIRVLQGEQLQDLELRLRRVDRDWVRVLSYSGAISHYGDGKGLAFLTIKDITERKQAEEALRDAKINLEYKVNERTAQLVAKSKELENFCYSVSHDLRAPLRGIDGYSRLLLESYHERLDEEGRTFLKNVRAATKHMTDLIEDLLAYSKLERRTPSSTSVRLSTFISNLLGQFQDLVGNVLLTVKVDDFHVNADPDALAIALRNLIDNALKFSRHASQPAIEISAQAGDGNCIISVRDNGIGFDMRFYDKIFEIFQRLHRIEEYPGTGIGLAMVHKAMERMGGRVWAESQLGNGAVFFLQLPLSCRAGETVPQADPGLSVSDTLPILLIEDNPMDVDLTRRAFIRHKLANPLKVARDGQEALDLIEAWQAGDIIPSVILLDLKLPKISGLEVLRVIRAHPIFGTVPVVVLTSSAEDGDINEAYSLGANSYIVKPVDFDKFIEVARQIELYWTVLNMHSFPKRA